MTTNTKAKSLTLKIPSGFYAVPITEDQWRQFMGSELEDRHCKMEAVGYWSVPVKYTAIAVSYTWKNNFMDTITLYGERTMSSLKRCGYDMEGRVFVDGKKFRGFTSSQLFELPDGRLLDVAVIHVCAKEPEVTF
jgi:hypothetical protein